MKSILTIISLLASGLILSQINKVSYNTRNFSYESNLRQQYLVDQIEKMIIGSRYYELSNISGSPYDEKEFKLGQVYSSNVALGKYLLRYNIFNEEIESIDENSKTTSFPKNNNLNFLINNRLLIYRDYIFPKENINKSGYYHVLSNGKNVLLLLKKNKIFKDGTKAQNSYQKDVNPRFLDRQILLIENKKNDKILIGKNINKKQILDLFENNKNIERYMKIKKTKTNNQDDLVSLIDYINSLML